MKLHLGCGDINIDGFINIDINEGKHVHIVGDVSDLSIFSDDSVDLIYASALFQYFDFIQGEVCLKEWCRVLKPGGVLRISTVDFDKLLEVYNTTNKDIDKIIGPMYGRVNLNNKNMEGDKIYHKSIYTKKKFISVLEKSGFSKVQPYDWKQSIHLDYDDQSQSYYPHMDKDNGIHIMQNWEAIK